MFRNFAHKNGIDTKNEFWIIKAVAAAALQHPYVTTGGHTFTDAAAKAKMGRPLDKAWKIEADLHEWWVQANLLRALMETRRRETLLGLHDFKLPSMRINAAHFTHSQQSAPKLRWAPSETEMTETKGWRVPYRRIRNEQLEKARSIAQR